MVIPRKMKKHRKQIYFLIIAFAFLVSDCGSGGGGSASVDEGPSLLAGPVDYASPEKESPVLPGAVSFLVHNGDAEKFTNGVYNFYIYSDSGLTELVASSDDITENEEGYAIWISDVDLAQNRRYWWKWSAVFDQGSYESGAVVVYVMRSDTLSAVSPRNSGYMDTNFKSRPRFGLMSPYTAGDVEMSYDFELYADSAMAAMVTSASDVTGEALERYMTWTPQITLTEGATYYWRARAKVNGFETAWSSLYSFTVKNLCDISGSRYPEHAIDLIRKRECGAIAHNDPTEAMGPPDGRTNPYRGFLSLDFGGEVVYEMGATIVDQPGDDLRVYEYVSKEAVEVLVAPSEIGPWFSLGVDFCLTYCDYDLGRIGVNYARFIKVRDAQSPVFACHETSGSDIDSVYWIDPVPTSGGCSNGFGPDVSYEEPTLPDGHSVPSWLKGTWKKSDIFTQRNVEEYNMLFVVGDTSFEYHQPGCDYSGTLTMNDSLPRWVANEYTMTITSSNCSTEWDIPVYIGKVDTGLLWTDSTGNYLYRFSYVSPFRMDYDRAQ